MGRSKDKRKIRYDHAKMVLSDAMGIPKERKSVITKVIVDCLNETIATSRIIEKIMTNHELTFAEKVFCVHQAGINTGLQIKDQESQEEDTPDQEETPQKKETPPTQLLH